jgi:hypothetical protein
MAGWVIGVLVEEDGAIVRRFFASKEPDRARAEWLSADFAQGFGHVASSPHDGHEPVEAVAPLSPRAAASLSLAASDVKSLGTKWPRRWLA